jgi:hypothetical protein
VKNDASFLVMAAGIATIACTPSLQIPGTLEPAGASLAMVVPAKGVQIYECRAKKSDAGEYEWAFVAPDAELFDMRGKVIGKHGAGPVWQAADGSMVTGKVAAKVDAPDARSIPWLLLETRSSGPMGSFSKVTSIQRVNTMGGIAPAKPCNGEMLGQRAGVHYTADYRFFVQR